MMIFLNVFLFLHIVTRDFPAINLTALKTEKSTDLRSEATE